MDAKQLKSFIVLLLVTITLTSCQNTATENEKYSSWQKVEFEKGTVYISSQKVYTDSRIKLAGAFDEDMKTVSVAFNNHMQASKSAPKDNEWEDTFNISQPTPDSQPLPNGKHKIAIVATPKNGSKSTTFETEIEVISKPNVTFTYNSSDFKEQDIVAKSDVKLLGITMKTPDGKLIPFKGDPTGLTFTLKHAMPSPKDGKAIVIIRQEENLKFEMKLFMEDTETKRLYYLSGDWQTDNSVKYYIKSRSTDFDDQQVFCELPMPDFGDDFIKSVTPNSRNNKLEIISGPFLLGMSDDKNWVLIKYTTNLEFKSYDPLNKFESEFTLDEKKLSSIDSEWCYVINTNNKFYLLLGTPKSTITYADGRGSFKIIGKNYIPIFWDKDELILIEQTYDGKIPKRGIINETGKQIAFDFNNKNIKDTNKLVFWRTWTKDGNLKTGITRYFDRKKDLEEKEQNPKKSEYIVSLTGKSWSFDYIESHFPKVISGTWCFTRVDVASTLVNGKPFVVLTALYQWYKYVEPEGDTGAPKPLYKKVVFDFETGKVGKFLEGDDKNCWVPQDNDFDSDDYPRFMFRDQTVEYKVRYGKIVGGKIEFEDKIYSAYYGFLR